MKEGEFKVGDRVTGEIIGLGRYGTGIILALTSAGNADCECADGIWLLKRDTLRPVSSPPAIAEKDRLHAKGCILCGAPTALRRRFGPNDGDYYCKPCALAICGKYKGNGDAHYPPLDAEITRRKALAASAQPAAQPAPSAPTPAPTPDPYATHRLKHDDAEAAALMAERDRIRGNRQREAFRMLDRGIKGPKYVYAETSGCFSTATWESD
jgi:hypothetical protein